MNPAIRRGLVAGGVAASLVVGGEAIQAAAAWTRAAAPLDAPPVTVGSLQSQLAAERARSAALLAQIGQLQQRAAQLGQALDAADTRLGSDVASAAALKAQLTATQQKLNSLLKAAQAAAARKPASAPATHATTGASGTTGGGETEGGDD